MTAGVHWPLTLQPRYDHPGWLHWAVSAGAMGVALALGALLLRAAGVAPGDAYLAMARAALGSGYALADTAVKATPLILCGLGCAAAFRMRLWNVGAEGQLLLGAWAAVGVGSFWLPPTTPRPLLLLLMAAAAAACGGLYAAAAGWLRARRDVSEILSTLMLVYVAAHWNNYWIFGPWSEGGFPLTPVLPEGARLWRLGGLGVHAGFALGLALAAALWWAARHTRLGFEVEVVGDNPRAARAAGVDVARTTVWIMALSGACAGLAGMVEVSGVVLRLQQGFSPGYGFTAIIVAWLARLHPGGVVLVSLLLGALLVGGREVQPAGVGTMLQGLLLFCVVGSELWLRYRLVWRRRTVHA